MLKILLDSGTFQDSASNWSKVFNILPSTAKSSAVFNDFKTLKILFDFKILFEE